MTKTEEAKTDETESRCQATAFGREEATYRRQATASPSSRLTTEKHARMDVLVKGVRGTPHRRESFWQVRALFWAGVQTPSPSVAWSDC